MPIRLPSGSKLHAETQVAPLSPSLLDKDLLSKQGFSIASIPPKHQQIQLSLNMGRRFGGANVHVETNTVHPDNTEMLVRATALLGLNISGIDFKIEDITHSWRSVRSGICEINSASGFNCKSRSNNASLKRPICLAAPE